MWYRVAALAAWMCCLSAPTLAQADPPESVAQSPSLEFPAAVQLALAARPELRGFVFRREAQSARREQAALPPALEASAELENVLGTGDVSGVHEAELTLGIGSTWERGGKRSARMAVADASLDAIDAQERLAVLEVSAETARRFVALAAAQERLNAAGRAAQQAQQVVELVAQRVRAAQSPKTESLNAEIQLAAAQLALDDARRAVASTQARLGEQWAEPDARPVAAMDLYALPATVTAAELDPLLGRLPDLEHFASAQRVREAEIRLARAQATADWEWFAGVRRLEGLDDQALVFNLSVPLGSDRRAASREAEARAELATVDGEREAALLRLRALLRTELATLASARAAEQVIRIRQLPQAGEVAELTLSGYRIGRYPYRDLALARQQSLDLERRRLDAAIAYHLSRVELERLIGTTLPAAPESDAHQAE